MTYATLDQLVDRYGLDLLVRTTDRADDPTGVVDADTVARVLAATDGVINGYLRRKYALPLPEVPDPLPDLAQSIAIYKLHRFEPDPKIDKEYKAAIATLAQIADGTITLSIPETGAAPASPKSTSIIYSDRKRPLTECNLKGFI